MAKYLTIEIRFDDDFDVYDDGNQQDVINSITEYGEVKAARVVGTGEGPDPEDATANPEQNVPADPGNAEGGEPTN
jgi:hypothetical protein